MPLNQKEHINLLGEIGTNSSHFFRKQAFPLHPDRNPNNPAAESQFKLLNTFKEICQAPSEFVQYGEERTISMKYESTLGPDDREYSATATLSLNPPLYKHPDLLANIKILYDLNDAQIESIFHKLDHYLITFMQNIFYVKQSTPFEKIFHSHKMPDKDLIFLLKNSNLVQDNALLTTQINALKAMPARPRYNTFNEDVDAHLNQVSNVIDLYQKNPIFHANLLQILLHLAYTHKTEPQKDFWPRYKKDIIESLNVALKVPVSLLQFLVLFTLLYFVAMIPLLLAAWFGALSGLPLIIFLLPIAAIYIGVIMECKDYIDYFFNEAANKPALCSKFIDSSLEKTFDVKFFATELASLLHEVNEIKSPATPDEPVGESIPMNPAH